LPLFVLNGNNPLAKWKNYKAKGFNLKSQHRKEIITTTTKTKQNKKHIKSILSMMVIGK